MRINSKKLNRFVYNVYCIIYDLQYYLHQKYPKLFYIKKHTKSYPWYQVITESRFTFLEEDSMCNQYHIKLIVGTVSVIGNNKSMVFFCRRR